MVGDAAWSGCLVARDDGCHPGIQGFSWAGGQEVLMAPVSGLLKMISPGASPDL
jgi:hypothetical protein